MKRNFRAFSCTLAFSCVLVALIGGCESGSSPPPRETPPPPTASGQPQATRPAEQPAARPADTTTPPRVSSLPPAFSEGPIRGLWITRWDYRTPGEVSEAIERAASLGVTDVFWQVRGQADAFYRSPYEPWGEEILAPLPPGVTDPGYDPLELAVAQAHARGLRLHAWINVMPLWKGTTPPKSPMHAFYLHPEWRLVDQDGNPQPLNEHYVIVNPVLDQVQSYIARVVADIVDRYAVDGIHLDYIRFVSESMDPSKVYPGDPRSMALFRAASGRDGVRTDDDRRAFRAWKRNRITDLVRRIGEATDRRPGVTYSAAVWRDPTIAQVQHLQDAALWLRDGVLDAAFPMMYTTDDGHYRDDWQAWRPAASGGRLVPGIGIYMHDDPAQSIRQINIASSPDGYALFAYASVFDSANPLESRTPEARAQRRTRRQALEPFIKQDRSP
jgi:uncharacterized lipoprotein YddW (UPF0748 family)